MYKLLSVQKYCKTDSPVFLLTVYPRSLVPLDIDNLMFEMGQDSVDTQYIVEENVQCCTATDVNNKMRLHSFIGTDNNTIH